MIKFNEGILNSDYIKKILVERSSLDLIDNTCYYYLYIVDNNESGYCIGNFSNAKEAKEVLDKIVRLTKDKDSIITIE